MFENVQLKREETGEEGLEKVLLVKLVFLMCCWASSLGGWAGITNIGHLMMSHNNIRLGADVVAGGSAWLLMIQ